MPFIPTVTRTHKNSVRLVSISNVDITGLPVIDGIQTEAGDRVLLAGQSIGHQNGIWIVGTSSWSRAPDFDSDNDIKASTEIPVGEGNDFASTVFRLTTNPPYQIDVTAFTFTPVTSGSGGGGTSVSSTPPLPVTRITASAGVSSFASRVDHKHDIATASAAAITPGQSSSEGSGTSLSRSDHGHALPAFGSSSGTFTEGNDVRVPPTPVGQNGKTIFSNNTTWEARVIGQTDIQTPVETIANTQINQLIAGKNLAKSGTSPALTFAYSPTSLIMGNIISDTLSSNQNNYSPTNWDDTEPNKGTILKLTVSAGCKLTGLAGGVEGRVVVFCNIGTTLLLIEPLSASSLSANQFSGNFPHFLMPGDTMMFIYLNSKWSREGSRNIGIDFDVFDDQFNALFPNIIAASGGSVAQTNTGAGGANSPIGTNLLTVTALTDRAAVRANSAQFCIPGSGSVLSLQRLNIPVLNDGTNRITLRSGLGDAEGTSLNIDGAYWVYNINSTAWQFGVSAASVPSDTATAVTVNTTDFYWLGVVVNSSWSRVDFFMKIGISGSWEFLGSKTSGLPSGSQTTNINCVLAKTLGGGALTAVLDVFAYKYNVLIQR